MRNELYSALAEAIAAAAGLSDSSAVRPLIERPKNTEFGDLAFACFALAKEWKLPPPKCAERLAGQLKLPPGVMRAVATGPFVNFVIERASYVRSVVSAVLESGTEFGAAKHDAETIICEYSSPNIAKPFHVGHLRATLVGNALDRAYRHRGYRVVSINHLGDWGTQFGFVWAGCKLWGKPAQPTVLELVELYRRATSLKEAQEKASSGKADELLPDVNEMARDYFLELEEGKPAAVEFWKWCLEISMRYFRDAYERLNVSFDHYTGESFYSDKLEAVRYRLGQAGILRESKGAIGVDLGCELGFARIYTPDGRSLYLARDLAAALYRWETFHFTKCLYVVGAPQTLHFRQLRGIFAAAGVEFAERIIHVPFGTVLGMKTRGSGEFVEINDFLDEASARALAAYRQEVEKRPEGLNEDEVARAVGLSAIVFSTLRVSRIKDVEFSWDRALAFAGDSGPYLLYAYARINGILEKAVAAGITATLGENPPLTEESAFSLAWLLEDFERILERVIEENEPAHLANYALELAYALSKAYLDLRVIGEQREKAQARLALFSATRTVLGLALQLLGVRLIERM